MKLKLLLLYFALQIFVFSLQAQRVGIGTASPHNTAILDINSTQMGMLPPRMTTAQRNAIVSPAAGLLIFNTNTNCMEYFNNSIWVSMCGCPPVTAPTLGSNSPICPGSTLNLTATLVAGATYSWSGPNGFTSTLQNPTIVNATAAAAGTYTCYVTVGACNSAMIPITVNIGIATPTGPAPYRSCKEIQLAGASTGDGVYNIDPDGAGALPTIPCYCDMTTDGGGWTLVLNYLHRAGTSPAQNVRINSLPLLGSTALGVDESGTAFWGHASNSLFNAMPGCEVRYYGKSGSHARIINFKTTHAGTMNYFRTGTGSCTGLAASFTALPGHTGVLPAASNFYMSNQGNTAMAEHAFWVGNANHFLMGSVLGGCGTPRWEMDDYPCGNTQNTFHQVWLR